MFISKRLSGVIPRHVTYWIMIKQVLMCSYVNITSFKGFQKIYHVLINNDREDNIKIILSSNSLVLIFGNNK